MSTLKDQMLRIYRDYQRHCGKDTVNTYDLFEWAQRTDRWKPKVSAVRRQFLDQLSSALRQEYFTDEKGQRVRKHHAVVREQNGKQISLWGDIRQAPEQHMILSFSQRRKQIASDCRQLKVDVDFFNENRQPTEPYQLELDFREDVAEMETEEAILRASRRRKPLAQKTSASVSKQPSAQSRGAV
jgi:hypothetical protein